MDVNALRQSCPLFRGISEEDLTAMLGCLSAREISPRRGDFIMRTPEVHPLMGVVLEGEVEMISEDLFGKKSLLSVLPVGSLFGESYTCVKARRRIIAYQARTHCRVLLLDYDRILHACKLVCRGCPDEFVPIATPEFLYARNGMDANGLFEAMKSLF